MLKEILEIEWIIGFCDLFNLQLIFSKQFTEPTNLNQQKTFFSLHLNGIKWFNNSFSVHLVILQFLQYFLEWVFYCIFLLPILKYWNEILKYSLLINGNIRTRFFITKKVLIISNEKKSMQFNYKTFNFLWSDFYWVLCNFAVLYFIYFKVFKISAETFFKLNCITLDEIKIN